MKEVREAIDSVNGKTETSLKTFHTPLENLPLEYNTLIDNAAKATIQVL